MHKVPFDHTMTLDDIWEKYEAIMVEYIPDAHITELAKVSFYNGADALIRIMALAAMSDQESFSSVMARSSESCRLVLESLDPENVDGRH